MAAMTLWPIIGMVVGGLLFIACAAWQLIANGKANAEIQETLSRYVLPSGHIQTNDTLVP